MSKASKPVVVAIADNQPRALRFAMDEASLFGSPLRVVYAYGVSLRASQFNDVPQDVADELRLLGQSVLDDARLFVGKHDPDLSVEYVLSSDAPLDALALEAANARTLVLGSDDVPWFDRLLHSKIAGHMARHAPCPVFVVPELDAPVGADGEIVLTLDGDTSAEGPVRLAFEEANARDCVLHVLHCTPPGTLGSGAETSRSHIAKVLAHWRAEYPDVAVAEGDAVGDAEAAIVRATYRSALVIVGRPHLHSVPFALSRPVAVKVLSEAHCPVAVVPGDYSGSADS